MIETYTTIQIIQIIKDFVLDFFFLPKIMDFSLESGTYEYSLSIVGIKMEVNFPCKMKVQHNTSTLTTQVSSNGSHKFIFNQEISIRQSLQKQYFQLQICLLTDKGAKYTAGVVKLFHNQLARSQGQRMILPLGRCLDKQATCEIIVDKISKSIVSGKRQTFGRLSKNLNMPMFDTLDIENIEYPQPNKFIPKQNYNVVAETKSQFQLPIHNTARNKVNVEWDQKSREIPQSYYQRNTSKSPNTRTVTNRSRVPKSIHQQQRVSHDFHDNIQSYSRDKLIQAQVYKQQYIKLKQKYRKQAQTAKNELNKRIELQNSQNTLKLQVMKYKLKAQEYERSSNDKSNKIKQLQTQLNTLQQRQLQIQYLRNDLQQKDHQLRIIDDTLRQLSHQNDELKAINQNKYNHEIEKIGQLKHQMENNKNKYQLRINQLEKQLKSSQIEWNSMEKEIIRLNSILDQQKNTNIQLQNSLTDKTYEFERILQSQKSSSQQSLDQMYNKLERIQRQLLEKQQQHRQLYKQNEKLKTTTMKLQYDKKLLLQDNDSLKSQYHDVKLYKQKYTLLFRQHKFLLQQKKQLEKQLEKTITTKDFNIQQMNLQYNDQIEYYKRMNKQTDQRAKNYSNKIIQLQGQMEIVKGQAEKVRRSNQNLIKQLAQSKQKQKLSKKALKAKQQQVLSLETQYSTIKQKSKNIDQLFKLQTDKLKDEIEKLKYELEGEYIKNGQLAQANNQMGVELGKVRVKLQFTEERLQKESASLRDRHVQLENLVKDYQLQISSLEDTINYLRQNEKQLSANLSHTQTQSFKLQQLSDKLQKKIKLLQQKQLNTQNTLRTKQQQISNLLYDREQLMKKINQLEGDINQLKSQGSILNSQKNKGLKIIQIYQDDLKKTKHDIGVFTLSLAEKERDLQTLKNQFKNVKDELMRSQLKFSGLKKETDRFRDSLTESLNTSFIPILSSLNIFNSGEQQRPFSWLNGVQIQKNRKTITETTSWTEIVSTIISHSKDLKLLINRLFQQVKTLQKQVQKMAQQQNMSSSKHQSSQFQLQRTINQLQNQLSSLLSIKQEQTIKYDHMIQQMNNTLKQKQHEITDLQQQLEDAHFTLNSINQEFQQTNDGHSKKLTEFKRQKLQVQQKYEDLCEKQMDLEDNLQSSKIQIQQLTTQLQAFKSTQHNLTQQISKLNAIIQNNEQQFNQLKRAKKTLLQKISQLQLQLSRETQLKNKTQLLLQEEEKKNHQLKEFTNNLMKQKESGIKADLVKTQQIINLETSNIELERDKEILCEQNERLKKSLQDTRQQLRTLSLKIKVIQDQISDLSSEKLKLNQKQKQKDRQLQQSLEQIKKLQTKHVKLIQRMSNQKHNFQQQLQQKNQQLKQRIEQYSEKIIQLQKIIHQKQTKIIFCQNTINQLQQQLWQKSDSIDKLQQEVSDKQVMIQQQKARVGQQLIMNQQLLAEVKQKQQNMFDLSGKLYNMQLLLNSRQVQHKNKLQQLDLQWTEKQQSLVNQYQQRLELIEKQRDYFKNIIDQKEQQITAIKSESKNNNLQQSSMKKTLQDKIKKLQQDRLQLFTLKTQEIQKLTDQIKRLTDAIRVKESENRRLLNEVDVARAAIAKIEEKSKQVEDKLKNVNKLYSNQLQQLKKKQMAYKSYKQWIVNQQWAMERDLKKLTAGFIKRFLENIVVDEKNSTKMVEIVKGFQTTLIETVSNKLEQQ